MKLSEIKLEALRMMNASDGIYLTEDTLTANDENYAGYISNMPGAINRCFSDLEARKVLPCKKAVFTDKVLNSDFHPIGNLIYADLHTVADLYEIEKVSAIRNGDEFIDNVEYMLDGDRIIVPKMDGSKVDYTIHYRSTIPRVTGTTPNSTEIDIPDYIATAIPYFIKGELFREDEPSEAAEARNFYENAIELAKRRSHTQGTLRKTVFSFGEV